MGRRNAGSDEDLPLGFLSVGHRPTGLRWQRGSSTLRYKEIAPSSVTFGDSFPPRGSLRVMLRWGDYYNNFLHKPPQGLPIAFPWGGRWAGEAGSDEGGPLGFLSVGHRPTGLRWQRGSSTLRYKEITPSSVTFGDSYGLRSFALDCIELSPGQFDPQGEACGTLRLALRYFSK